MNVKLIYPNFFDSGRKGADKLSSSSYFYESHAKELIYQNFLILDMKGPMNYQVRLEFHVKEMYSNP